MGADTLTHKGAPSGGGAMVMMALWGLLALLAITLGAKAVDTPYAIHMFVFALAAILALIFKARSFGKPAAEAAAAGTEGAAPGAEPKAQGGAEKVVDADFEEVKDSDKKKSA